MRARYQVLVIPFIYTHELTVAIFQRSDDNNWQFIAGGGENSEEPLDAARREALEEAGIDPGKVFIKLDTVSSVPKSFFLPFKDEKGFYVIPEYCYAVKLESQLIRLSSEHKLAKWVGYDEAISLLRYDGNKNALWELKERIINNDFNSV